MMDSPEVPKRPHRSRNVLKRALVVVAVLCVAGGAFAAGRSSDDGEEKMGTRQATATVESPPACIADAEAVGRKLRELNSRIDVGVNVGEYANRVGDARVAYDERASKSGPCQEVFTHYDLAILEHTLTAAEWQSCIQATEPSCNVNTVATGFKSTRYLRIYRIDKAWARADRERRRGDAALRDLK